MNQQDLSSQAPDQDAAPTAPSTPSAAPAPSVADSPLTLLTSPALPALAEAVLEVEAHMAGQGWDGPVGVFALVRTAAALRQDPQLRGVLDEAALERAATDEYALTVIEQEDLPPAGDLEELLGQLAWPQEVDGVVLSVERVILPPQAEEAATAITDESERMAYLRSRTDRQDVRMVVGVLRQGESWCVLRTRAHDDDASLIQGADIVPGLVQALHATLE